MPRLVLGPLLRYVAEREATIWVETDGPCEIEVLGHRARTFHVEGHHYGLVAIRGLAPGRSYPYELRLDGEVAWPEPESEFPQSALRTLAADERIEVAFGSCRVAVPHEPPYTLTKDEDPRGREIDALYALAMRMRGQPETGWPDLLMLLGDQVYADEDAPQTREFIRGRRDVDRPPGEEVADFEEYTRLYRESWREPAIRWLLSTVPSLMIFDDHDVHDDWNTSAAWIEQMRAQPWWRERILGALTSYWVYQHIGNLSPDELDDCDLLRGVKAAADGGPILRAFAERADAEPGGSRWSFSRDLGRTRLIVLDTREGRVLPEGGRKMLDDREFDWVASQAVGDFDHLLFANTLPFLLVPAFHHVEAWNEAVCAGAWGGRAARLGERLRQALDLEHWAAFERSFTRFSELLRSVGRGELGRPPATIVWLAGDVHHAYLAEAAFRDDPELVSSIWQAVCSPFRNALDAHEQHLVRAGATRLAEAVTRLLPRAAGVRPPRLSWRLVEKPLFDNQVATLELNGRAARLRIERTVPGDWRAARLETSLERRIA